jgi:hypothetical protein
MQVRQPGAASAVTAAIASCLLALGARAAAAGAVTIQAGEFDFQGLEIRGLVANWSPATGSSGRLALRAAKIRGVEATGPLAGFSIDCPELRIAGDELRCDHGHLSGSLGSLGVQDTRFAARRRLDGRLSLAFDQFALAGGRGRVELELQGARWEAQAKLAGLDLARLAEVAKPWVALPADFAVSGQAAGEFRAKGSGDVLATAGAAITLESLDFANDAGTVDAAAAGAANRMSARGKVALASGQAYSEPVFLDFGAQRAVLDFDGLLDTEAARFEARSFALDHAGVVQAAGSATVDFAGETLLPTARVRLGSLTLAKALPAYAQPFLVNTAFRDVAGKGVVRGEVAIDGGLPTRVALDLEGVSVGSETAAVSLAGIAGSLRWFDDASRTRLAGEIEDSLFASRLAWERGRLWGLELGAAELPFTTTGRHFRLLEPVTIPVFDGGLAIDTLRVRHAGTDEMYVRFDAAIQPISVALLSRAFGWPEFQGALAGSIPGLQLRQGVVTLDGALEAKVFDGRVAVRELSLREPLGKYPRLFADIGVENLDLELVTRTFEFGTITGRLSGYISDLETFDWMPEAFDAFLYTPPDDRSRHRISQRAVTNLSSIGGGSGGGVAAVLQGGFLRFFEDFRYDRVGLSCRLANDVCIMGGVLPAPGGYYIVKGAGLPRINVIGSQTRVAWTTLVRQLGAVMESELVVE